jgi:hypothetical protein
LRFQSDSVSRYTSVKQNDTVCDLMPGNRPKGAHGAKPSN